MALEDILESLEEEARKQSADIMSRAKTQADDLMAEAERDVAQIRESTGAEAAERLRSQEAKMLLEARFQAKKRVAEAKEKLVEEVFAEAGSMVGALPEHVSYPSVFRFLTAELVKAAGNNGAAAVLKVSSRDVSLAEEAALKFGTDGSIKVESDPSVVAGVAMAIDGGRRTGVNTLDSRLAKARQTLRTRVGAVLFDVDN